MTRILLIEDYDALRNILALALQRAGFEVVCAENGQEGLDRFRTASFDVVITDLVMPEMEGVETIMAMRSSDPGLKIIAMSGASSNSSTYLDAAQRLGAAVTLSKPFRHETLIQAVRDLLGSKSAR